jgi:hypothetical protein
MASTTETAPNLFELQGDKVRISYSTSSISGQPVFDFRQGRKELHFSGAEIQTGKTSINLQQSGKVKIKTIGIITTIKTSIGGPKSVKGAMQAYKVENLSGTAKAVHF